MRDERRILYRLFKVNLWEAMDSVDFIKKMKIQALDFTFNLLVFNITKY
jgi:hypothetical protein